jgi:exosortase family protein XrtM
LFVAGYISLYVGYVLLPDALLRQDIYYYGVTLPAQYMIDWLTPGEHVRAFENHLHSPRTDLLIVRGCDGANVAFLLVAAIIARRSALRATLLGLLGAVILVYVINEVRIAVLFFVSAYRPPWFVLVHVYIIPSFMILIATVYYAAWTAFRDRGLAFAAQA